MALTVVGLIHRSETPRETLIRKAKHPMAKKSDKLPLWMAGAAIVVVGASTFLFGIALSSNYWQDIAIKAGVAEWKIDPQTGKKSFVFLGKDSER